MENKEDNNFEELPFEAKLSLLKQKISFNENRFYNLANHYIDYGYRKIRKFVHPTLILPEKQPEFFNLLLTAVALTLILTPMIAGIVYLKHHHVLNHYAHTLNDLDIRNLKSHWGKSHYFDSKLLKDSHTNAGHTLSENLINLPKHNKYVGDLGLLYRQLHKYHDKYMRNSILDRVSEPVYNRMVNLIKNDLPGGLRYVAPQRKPIFFPYLFLFLPFLMLFTAFYFILFQDDNIISYTQRMKYIQGTGSSTDDSRSGKVVLFTNAAGNQVPLVMPYDLKLETYLRLAGIPYQLNTEGLISPHYGSNSFLGRNPWINYLGKQISDAQLCIDYLKKHFKPSKLEDSDVISALNLDLDKGLNERERSVSKAVRVFAETRLQWPFYLYNFVYRPFDEFVDQMHLSKLQKNLYIIKVICYLKPKIKSFAKLTGYWDMPESFTKQASANDVMALSNILGNKHYMMGEHASEVDCSVFAFLAALYYSLPDSNWLKQKISNESPNLIAYMDRVKEKYWPDWDQRLKSGVIDQ